MAKQAMSIDEVISRLDTLGGDSEAAHSEADSLLMDALLALKADGVVSAYLDARSRVGFWYA